VKIQKLYSWNLLLIKAVPAQATKAYTGCKRTALLILNTLRTGDADLRFYITTVQDG